MIKPAGVPPHISRPFSGWIVTGVLLVLVAAALIYVLSSHQQSLRSSPAGLDGLRAWLVSEGQSVQNFSGGWPLNEDETGLLVIPLYDTRLDEQRNRPQSSQELIMQQDEYDLAAAPILEKARRVNTLLVLPKWRSGMRLTGVAHPDLLVEAERVEETLRVLLNRDTARIVRDPQASAAYSYTARDQASLKALLYGSQLFSAPGCSPIIGTADVMILGTCYLGGTRAGTTVMVLSDPDLINNHGLRAGDNAFIVSDFIGEASGGRQVIIDYSLRSWFASEGQNEVRERTWSDLARFFSPPFTLIWMGLLLALVLILWRAAVRFGPLRTPPDALGASNMMAIAARAKLMRLSNQDGALIQDYGKARLAVAASALFGAANARTYSSAEAFLAYTARRHPSLAGPLAQALSTLRSLPAHANAAQAFAAVDQLEAILEQITDGT